MGLTAAFVLCRSDTPIDELASIAKYDDWCESSEIYSQRWQLGMWSGLQLLDHVDDVLTDIVAETGAPALLAFVLQSDFADVNGRGGTPQSEWRACLCRSGAAASFESDNEMNRLFLPPDAAARAATTWAIEAGLTPAPAALEALFTIEHHGRPAEEALSDLITCLGAD